MDVESLSEMRHAMKTLSLEDLGLGRSRGVGAAGKKRRFDVLDRLACIGQGLAAAQKNDFGWWKDNWDARMLEEHGVGGRAWRLRRVGSARAQRCRGWHWGRVLPFCPRRNASLHQRGSRAAGPLACRSCGRPYINRVNCRRQLGFIGAAVCPEHLAETNTKH